MGGGVEGTGIQAWIPLCFVVVLASHFSLHFQGQNRGLKEISSASRVESDTGHLDLFWGRYVI